MTDPQDRLRLQPEQLGSATLQRYLYAYARGAICYVLYMLCTIFIVL